MKNLTGCAKVTRLQYSESYREKAASIPKSSLIVPGRPFKPLSGVELNQIVSYIQTGGEAILVWLTWDIKSIIVFTMGPMSLPEGKAIIMSINDLPEIRDIYQKFNMREVNTIYTSAGAHPKKQAKELLITNYDLPAEV